MQSLQKRVFRTDLFIMVTTLIGLITIRAIFDVTYRDSRTNLINLLFTLFVWTSSLYASGCYDLRYIGMSIEETQRIVRGSINAFLVIGTVSFILKHSTSRYLVICGLTIGITALAFGRKLRQRKIHDLRRDGHLMRKTLIIGGQQSTDAIVSILDAHPEYGFLTVGRIPIQNDNSLSSESAWLETIDQSIKSGNVTAIIIEDAGDTSYELLSLLSWKLNLKNVEVLIAPSFLNHFGPRLESENHHELPLLYVDEPGLSKGQLLAKRIVDLVISVTALLILSPIFLFTMIAIKLTSRGPIFFVHNRVGKNGELFRFIKFRSMIVDAQKYQAEVWANAADTGVNNKDKNDPRVTSVGRFIRKYSIDELPQLLNVIKGDMSIVGPRPIQMTEFHELDQTDLRRHLIKPGMTGLWQISGRSDTTWEERIQFDLDYVHQWSPGLDLAILLKTIKVVATGEGSY